MQDQVKKGVEDMEVRSYTKLSQKVVHRTTETSLFDSTLFAVMLRSHWVAPRILWANSILSNFFQDVLKFEPGREYTGYLDANRVKTAVREKRTVKKEMMSHAKLHKFLKEQNKLFSGYIKATTEVSKN